jgi:hypothetical protein
MSMIELVVARGLGAKIMNRERFGQNRGECRNAVSGLPTFQRCLNQPVPVRTESALSKRFALQVADQSLADVGSEFASTLNGSAQLR